MKEIFEKKWDRFLTESSLSRIHQHMMEHETAVISAYRNDIHDSKECTDNAVVAGEGDKNILRSRDLKATLLSQGFGVTKVQGSYIENYKTDAAIEVAEKSLLVVNLTDNEEFFSLISQLGEKFCQDSVLLIPRGGKNVFLRGTNNHEFPGYGNDVEQGDIKMGEHHEFMTRVGGRSFAALDEIQTYKDLSKNSRMAVKSIAKRILE